MNLTTCLIATLLLPLSLFAEDAAASRELIVAAIGEIPVPKMKVTEVMGRRGYEADEGSTKQWFPKEWTVSAGGSSIKLQPGLNMEPVAMKLPAGSSELQLSPAGVPAKPQQLPAVASDGLEMMIVFNREPEKTWDEGFATRLVSCVKLDAAAPSAIVLNLSGATVTITGRDRVKQALAPGKSASAPVFVNSQRGINLLPLSATAGGKTYPLDLTPLDLRAPHCPVVVVYPSAAASKKERPLKVAVIQPSSAIRKPDPEVVGGS